MAEGFSYKFSYDSSPYIRHEKKPKLGISITLLLVIITVAIFLVQNIVDYTTLDKQTGVGWFTRTFGLIPNDVLHGEHVWSIFTNIFLHAPLWDGGLFHIAANMLSLVFLGSFLERLISKKKLFWIYIISGIVASLFFIILASLFGSTALGARLFGSPNVLAVGASGAIFGLAAVLMILTPKVPVYIFFIPIAMPLWVGMLIMLIGLWAVSAVAGLPIGNSAHLGGFIAGLFYGIYLRTKYPKKVALIRQAFHKN
ncbi:MAG: rhomboid family intramembrane serine protease [Candidatus Pacearchaeota archaeon]|nr:rhomboid family intramembrane serine protease [Candidatus Pacearchaeota archaeon]